MQNGGKFASRSSQENLCPDLTSDWQISQNRVTNQVRLQAIVGNRCYQFDEIEGYALQHFTGQYTASQVEQMCRSHFRIFIPSDLIVRLLEKLVDLGVLPTALTPVSENHTLDSRPVSENQTLDSPPKVREQLNEGESLSPNSSEDSPRILYGPKLKSTVQWIPHPSGYWILRNSEGVTCLQVDNSDKEVMEKLGWRPISDIADVYDITLEDLQYLLRMLAETGMLQGTQPQKQPPNKFNFQQLLCFQIPLFNPDAWLTQHTGKLRWLWTWQFGFFLCVLISASLAIWLAFADEVSASNQQVWAPGEVTTLLTFVLLIMVVVGLHELGHAFTLKHYGGVVPEIGLLFLCLIPGCYTDTTDQYSLVKRKQRVLVVAAGVVVQVAIWALSVWVWVLSKPNPGWHSASYLLMVATLVTVVFNLNPLNKFDGYYLLVALTGINNLRSRSFQFYARLLRREHIWEAPSDCWTLAAYAPFSIAYTVWVLSYLFSVVVDFAPQNMPMFIDFSKFNLLFGR